MSKLHLTILSVLALVLLALPVQAAYQGNILPIARGGTGSATQNFVDLTTGQSIAGAKSFTTSVAIGGGTALTRIAVYSQSLDVASVPANSTAEQTFTVSGLTTSDKVVLNKPSHTAGLVVANARVSAADTLAVTFANISGAPIDPAGEAYSVVAIRN